jgi:tetratricopeptide (TPR) repeat protein
MAIRKEQVLTLLALATAVLAGRKYFNEPLPGVGYRPTKIDFTATAVAATPLVTETAAGAGRRDFCTEPSETQPLPPRELDFPPRAALSLAALPLDPGPDLAHAWLLTTDGAQVDGVTLQTADAGAAPADAPAQPQEQPAEQGGTQKDKEERAALIYDRVWIEGQNAPHFGTIDPEGVDLFDLEKKDGQLDGVVLRQREFLLSTQKVGAVIPWGKDDKQKIVKIRLAGTLRNEITRRIRAVPPGPSPKERHALVSWLLEKARGDASVYDEALEQAKAYVRQAPGDIEGLRLVQTVLRARGDLAGEFAMLDGLQGDKRESAFRYEGLGVLKARLCLYADAEPDLRHAVAIAPTDARPHAALAEFLRERHRSSEAVEAAQRAEQTLGSVLDPVEQAHIVRVLVACHLAVGDLDKARAALKRSPVDQPQPYLEGCVLYAAGQPGQALGLFRQAAGSADGSSALLGQAASLLRDAKWQEAYDTFARVFDQEPLLRHRAATGLALVCSRLGQFDPALVWIDRALEAEPRDAYAYYLRGRTLRLMGQLGAAEEALSNALRIRDDFVHAIAEMAAVQAAKSSDKGVDNAAASLAARRYGDRAVALVDHPSVELYELQGKYDFAAAEPRRAQEAFERARDLAPTEPQKLFAKGALAVVDYRRGLVVEAQDSLGRLVNDSGLGKDDPMKKWAEATTAAIDDHAGKEMLTDNFDRPGPEPGSIWLDNRDGPVGPSIVGEALVLRGTFTATGDGTHEVSVQRIGGVTKGKNFLAVRCTMQLGPKEPSTNSFAGLCIQGQRGGGNNLSVRVGIKEGKPSLRLEDGRDAGQESVEQLQLPIDHFDAKGKQELELRVVPRGEATNRNFTLLVSWNGVVVHRHDLKMLTGNTQPELHTILFATGKRGDEVDVRFDEYRLERRKDK